MPNRASTLESVEIHLEILRRIPRHQYITTKELHEQLEHAGYKRDKRTIERHINELSTRFGIECNDQSKPYRYRWMKDGKGAALPMLSQQESLLLALAEEHLRNILPVSLMKSMDSLFNQANYDLRHRGESQKNREWLEKVRVVSETQPLIAAPIVDGVFEEVSNALYNNTQLNLVYKNQHGKITKSSVKPLGLAQQGSRLYLVCRYDGHSNEVSLALHRILSAKESTLPFERPPEFSLAKYDNDGRFGYGEGKRIKLVFKIEKKYGGHLLETKLSTDQVAKEMDGWLEITATVVDTAQLTWWLRGFGEHAVVIEKSELIHITHA